MAGSDARLSPERVARVLGLDGPGTPRPWGRPPIAGSVRKGAAVGAAVDVSGHGPVESGWVPDQPGPPRPGAVGRLLGRGRHREVSTLRERLSVPAGLRGALIRPSTRAVLGLAFIVLLAVAVVVVRVWRAEAAAAPVEVSRSATTPGALVSRSVSPEAGALGPPGPASAGRATGSGGFAGSGGAPAPTALGGSGSDRAMITVHVVGAVSRPGVIRIASGARLVDAVQRCGGAARGADLAAVNLARVLADGEQVLVPVVGRPRSQAPGTGPQPSVSTGDPSGAQSPGKPVDLNAADAAALDQLPGIGPKIAERIITWRAEHGRFSSVEELGEVSGIGDKLLSRLRPLVTV